MLAAFVPADWTMKVDGFYGILWRPWYLHFEAGPSASAAREGSFLLESRTLLTLRWLHQSRFSAFSIVT
jgi:hypothetical protein